MAIETLKQHRMFGGVQGFYTHDSSETGTRMRFSVFQPAGAERGAPVLVYLSGLTCTDENFTTKAGAQRVAAQHGLVLVAPDTSPRGLELPGEHDSYDFGSGAGFYVDATEEPWSKNYRMYSYVVEELPRLLETHFGVDLGRMGVFGHSMGGHGALVTAFRNPDRFRSVSALSPICAPTHCPWGKKAFRGYLGTDEAAWKQYDASELAATTRFRGEILVDQGSADEFLERELMPERLTAACSAAGIPLTLRMHDGYDHSYYFIATFAADHVEHHARVLCN